MNTSHSRHEVTETLAMYKSFLNDIASLSDGDKIARIKDFIKMYPDFAQAHNDLGVLHYHVGNKLLTLGHYQKANFLAPYNITFKKNLASFYFVEMGWTDDAIEIYTEIFKSYPNDTETIASLGIISSAVGQQNEARIFLTRLLELEPWNNEARQALDSLSPKTPEVAQLQVTEKAPPEVFTKADIDSILSSLRTTITKPEKNSHKDTYGKAQSLVADGRLNDAIREMENLLGDRPGDPIIHNDLGVLYQKIGNPEKSLEHHEMAVARSPRNQLFLKNLASLLYVEMGRTDDAIGLYLDLLQNYPDDVEVLSALAIISSANNRPDEACIFLRKILELDPKNSDAHTLLTQLDPYGAKGFFLAIR